jgi:hypothetical protein
MINMLDVQRGYDAWAAKPHNAKWVSKIDGTPIANDIVATIWNTLRDTMDERDPSPTSNMQGVDFPRLPIGTVVEKVGGYPFPGTVVTAFHTLAGQERFVVEATGEQYAGMLHIFNGGQLRAVSTPAADTLTNLLANAKARLAAMTEEESKAMWQAQKQSMVRAMTTGCEHGVLDFEDCPQCRNPAPPVDHVELRKRVMRAIFDPGATEGFKGDRNLTTWQTDAVMRVMASYGKPATEADHG